MVSSIVGSPTSTGWKRRSSAGSFSMCSRYSSSVVAPTIRSSPRASIGLSMLPASIEPSPLPAPTTVCSSSRNVMTCPLEFLISSRTDLSRSSNWPRYCAPATIAPRSSDDQLLVAQRLGHVAGHDPLGQALDDRGLADAGLTDQHRVVLGTPGEHLDDPADLGVPADDRVDLAVPGAGGEVDAVLRQRLVGLLRVGGGDPPVATPHGREGGDQGFLGGTGRLQRAGHRAADPGQAGEQVLGGGVLVAQRPGDLLGGADGVDELPGQGGLGDAGAAGGRQAVDRALGGPAQLGRVGPDGAQQAGGGRAVGVQQRQQQVPGLDGGVTTLVRRATAPVMVSRLLVVSLSVFMGSPGSALSTELDTTRVERIPLNLSA